MSIAELLWLYADYQVGQMNHRLPPIVPPGGSKGVEDPFDGHPRKVSLAYSKYIEAEIRMIGDYHGVSQDEMDEERMRRSTEELPRRMSRYETLRNGKTDRFSFIETFYEHVAHKPDHVSRMSRMK